MCQNGCSPRRKSSFLYLYATNEGVICCADRFNLATVCISGSEDMAVWTSAQASPQVQVLWAFSVPTLVAGLCQGPCHHIFTAIVTHISYIRAIPGMSTSTTVTPSFVVQVYPMLQGSKTSLKSVGLNWRKGEEGNVAKNIMSMGVMLSLSIPLHPLVLLISASESPGV